MQADDVAWRRCGSRSDVFLLEILLRVSGDGLHTVDEPFRRLDAPIARKQRPHCRFQAEVLGDFAEPGIAESVRWVKPVWYFQGRFVDSFGTALEFLAGFLARAEEKIGMSLRVIADEVAAR